MQLVGITSLGQASPELLNTTYLDRYVEGGIRLGFREGIRSRI